MLLSEILRKIQYKIHNNVDISATEIRSISYDSRKVYDESMFFCLIGAASDGHDYALHAYNNGCRVFVCSKSVSLPDDSIIIAVKDTRKTLALASSAFFGYPSEKLTIVGITGTKGKTTSALLAHSIFNANGLKCAYIGSNGITVGDETIETINTTPESYELHYHFSRFVKLNVKYVVMEVSSQAVKTDRIFGINFDVCVFLNLSPDHIGAGEHTDFEDYKNCKKRLFSDYGCKCVIYNADDEYSAEMTGAAFNKPRLNAASISFGIKNPADISASDISLYREASVIGVEFDCFTSGGNDIHVKMRSPGDFSVYNGLAAMMICRQFGVTYEDSARVLEETSVKGRFEIVDSLPYCTFVIDYAHNEVSLSRVLDVLRKYKPARLICVFGSVGGRVEFRRVELGMVASELADYSIITSDNPNYEDPMAIIRDIISAFTDGSPYEYVKDRETAVRNAVNMAGEGDIVLFAGKGHETYQLINGKKKPFSEREIIESESAKLQELDALRSPN